MTKHYCLLLLLSVQQISSFVFAWLYIFFEMLVIITVKIYLSWMLNFKIYVKTVHKKIVVIVRLANRKRLQTGPY